MLTLRKFVGNGPIEIIQEVDDATRGIAQEAGA